MLLAAACKPQPKPAKPLVAGPETRATVVTIETVLQPGNRTLTHTIAIAGDHARSGDELDRWRLFDLKKNEVTFVDDVAKTYRTVPLASLLATRRAADAQPLAAGYPRAQVSPTKNVRTLQGVAATQLVVRLGGYQRQLWIGTHPLIPQNLFALMEAGRPPTTNVEAVMRAVDEALVNVRGFPLAEHAELPFGKGRMVVDKSVVKIEQRNVPAAWLNVGAGYKDVTPQPKAPAARRPAAS
jgi:hypothetical protein